MLIVFIITISSYLHVASLKCDDLLLMCHHYQLLVLQKQLLLSHAWVLPLHSAILFGSSRYIEMHTSIMVLVSARGSLIYHYMMQHQYHVAAISVR